MRRALSNPGLVSAARQQQPGLEGTCWLLAGEELSVQQQQQQACDFVHWFSACVRRHPNGVPYALCVTLHVVVCTVPCFAVISQTTCCVTALVVCMLNGPFSKIQAHLWYNNYCSDVIPFNVNLESSTKLLCRWVSSRYMSLKTNLYVTHTPTATCLAHHGAIVMAQLRGCIEVPLSNAHCC